MIIFQLFFFCSAAFLSPTLSYFVFSPSVVVAGTSFEITVSSFDTWGNPGGVSSTNNQPVISAALNPTGAGSVPGCKCVFFKKK